MIVIPESVATSLGAFGLRCNFRDPSTFDLAPTSEAFVHPIRFNLPLLGQKACRLDARVARIKLTPHWLFLPTGSYRSMKISRLSIGPKNRSSTPRIAEASDAAGFELLCDSDGTIVFGWAARSVLYTRFEGGLSAQAGRTYATRLGSLVAQNLSFAFFCDLSSLKRYDLLARSAFVRVVLCNRLKFTSLTVLTWSEGISPVMRVLIDTLGDPIEVLTDGNAFEARLLKMAPLVRRKFDPKTWVAVTPLGSGVRKRQ
jgi:hypothetical protein